MQTFAVRAILLAGALLLWQEAAATTEDSVRLERLIGEYVELVRSGGSDDPIFRESEVSAVRDRKSGMLSSLRDIDASRLTRAQQVDRLFLIGVLESDLRTAAAQQRWATDPAMYVPARQLGKLLDPDSPGSRTDRAAELKGLIESLPENLAHAKDVLHNPPRRFTEEAIFQVRNTLETIRDQAGAWVETVAGKEMAPAIEALASYLEFLEQDLAPRSGGSWVFGESNYDFILQKRWHMDATAGDILERGRQAFETTEKLAVELSARMDPEAHWTEVYERLKDNHASAEGLKQAYQQPMDRAKAFVIEHGILTLPPGERVITLDTPPAMRRSSPFGTFQSVSAFDDGLEGRLYLTPVESWMTEQQKEDRLRSHHLAWTPVIAVHEAYPGHHAHFLKSRENPRLLRRVAREPIFSEGWGLYTEELMFEWGFLEGDEIRLTQLRNRLWRAARVVLDVSLHTGKMNFESAVDFLVEKVRFDRYAAELEVGMYIRRPTYVLGYLVGMQELEKIRADWISKYGEPDPPSIFFDRLLTVGSIPPALARIELMDEPLP